MVDILVAALQIIAAVFIAGTAIALWRAPDALTRVNLMGPTTGVGLPLLVIAKLVHDLGAGTIDPNSIVRAVVAIIALWVVAAVASFYLARAIHDAIDGF